jgi:hypothetical protein
MSGMAGVAAASTNSPQDLLRKLGERLAFERDALLLYDALLRRWDELGHGVFDLGAEELRRIREQEARHCGILAVAIGTLGGDPGGQGSDMGQPVPGTDILMRAVNDPAASLAQALAAVLELEQAEQTGWEALITLADLQQHHAMRDEFSAALEEEHRHLLQVRRWHKEAAQDTTPGGGEDADMNPP